MKDDLAANGGRIYLTDGIPNLELPSLINIDGEPEDTTAPRIKPSSSWQLRYYATLYPMIRYSSTVDRQLDFGKRSRISYAGGAQDPTVDAAANLDRAVFTHPVTLLEYNAYNIDGAEMAPGYQLIEDANAFVSDGGDWYAANAAYEAAQAAVLAEQEGDNDASTLADLKAVADDAEDALDIQGIRLQEKVHIIEIVRSLSEALEFSN